MSMYWDKLLDIVDKTREKIFFFSANRTYVVMSLENYEELTSKKSNSDQDELVERINEDIASLKAKMSAEQVQDLAQSMQEEEDDNEFQIEPVDIN